MNIRRNELRQDIMIVSNYLTMNLDFETTVALTKLKKILKQGIKET